MSFIDRVCDGYAAIVKWFALILSTFFLIISVALFWDAITWPNHSEFKPSYEAKSFVPDKRSLADTKAMDDLSASNCADVKTADGIEKTYFYDLAKVDFRASAENEKANDAAKYFATCLQKMFDIYDVQDFNQWKEYNEAVRGDIKDSYLETVLALQTMRQFQRDRVQHDAMEKNLSWNNFQIGISGGFFLAFVMSSILLLVVRIESNTRKSQ